MKADNTINGRTPEEIKRMLRCLSTPCAGECEECEYNVGEPDFTPHDAYVCSLERIQQLERERDAAVRDMRDATLCGCHVCKHYYRPDANVRIYACKKFGEFGKFDYIKDDGSMFCGAFEWRGVQEVE